MHIQATAERTSDGAFFSELPEIRSFSEVTRAGSYHPAPATWSVVITDVCGSTRAIEAGRYKDVNALGAGCIIAVRNAVAELELPYVFGGDGATLLVPVAAVARTAIALRGMQELARDAFALELRAGVVPVIDLATAGHAVRVARYRASPHLCLAMFAGSGWSAAERWVKEPERAVRYALPEGEARADLDGFECRWQPIKSRRGRAVSLLVLAMAASEDERSRVYARVLSRLDELSDPESRSPVAVRSLRLGTPFSDYSTEARMRSGAASGTPYERARAHVRKKTLIGRALVGLGATAGGFDGKRYPREVAENTDFRKFDGTLRMVLDLSLDECAALEAFLEAERGEGHLTYGMHRAESAIVTCYVRSYSGDHVHFVDGSDGGYALAAKQLKAQLAAAGKAP